MTNENEPQVIAKSPVVDSTCINAVESLFRGGTRDPWAIQQACRFADYYVFSQTPRYVLPVVAEKKEGDIVVPSLVTKLYAKDNRVFDESYCTLSHKERSLDPAYLEECFESFVKWTNIDPNNRSRLRQWLNLHRREEWIRCEQHQHNIGDGYLFNVENLYSICPGALRSLLLSLDDTEIIADDICYAFDVILRYALYGEKVGDDQYYLSHPIREEPLLPHLGKQAGRPPTRAYGFGEFVGKHLAHLNLDGYVTILHEVRDLARAERVVNDTTGCISDEATRDFLGRLKLVATSRKAERALGLMGKLTALTGTIVRSAPVAATGGAIVAANYIWQGKVPAPVCRWLRWGMEYHVKMKER